MPASLTPRLCPAYPLEAVDESVLVLLSSKADEFEYADDAVDAFEGCRLDVGKGSAVCVCRRVCRYDITASRYEISHGYVLALPSSVPTSMVSAYISRPPYGPRRFWFGAGYGLQWVLEESISSPPVIRRCYEARSADV